MSFYPNNFVSGHITDSELPLPEFYKIEDVRQNVPEDVLRDVFTVASSKICPIYNISQCFVMFPVNTWNSCKSTIPSQ